MHKEKEMNKQRKVVITTTYNEMGIIIDTKADEVPQLNLQPTCNQLATDTISRQAAIEAFGLSEKTRKYGGDHSGYDTRMLYEIQDVLENLPSVTPEPPYNPDEWCHDCKEYDQERHCCPRFNRVIKQTKEEFEAQNEIIYCKGTGRIEGTRSMKKGGKNEND